jgi:hypothetical protein
MPPVANPRHIDSRLRWQIAVVAIAVAAAVVPSPPGLVERFYSTGIYPALQVRLTPASNRVPFALMDLLVAGSAFVWIALAVADLKRRDGWLRVGGRLLARSVVAGATLYLVFLVVWGFNYRRVPLFERLQFDPAQVSQAAARELAATAIAEANELYDRSPAKKGSAPFFDPRLADAFAAVQRDLGAGRLAVPGRPKRTLLDIYLRRAAVDGMTDPYFLETLIARDLLPFEQPVVVAHEWSHLAGYADESEANFVGWLTCVRAGGDLAYSGWLFLYGELIGTIGAADRRGLPALGPGPRGDRRAIAERLQRNVSPRLSAAGWIVYDRYLKANRVEAGTASYAEVVRLVLGTRFGPNWMPRLRGG